MTGATIAVRFRLVFLIGLLAAFAGLAPATAAPVGALADRYVAIQLQKDPTLAELGGLPGREDLLPDISPASIERLAAEERTLWLDVRRFTPDRLSLRDRRTFSVLREALADDLALRSCRSELWSLNHIFGWQIMLPNVAQAQPVSKAPERAAALARWSSLPEYIAQDTANLQRGLDLGYSVPKTVVRRVIAQLDALIDTPVDASPFSSPARRSDDAKFRQSMTEMVGSKVVPALREYRRFLSKIYLPRARHTYGVSALPNGRECYRASLRAFTTLPISPEQVYASGERLVARNEAELRVLGARLFGTSDLRVIAERLKTAPGNSISSPADFLDYSRDHLARNVAATRKVIADYPRQDVVIEPLPVEVTTAQPPHYEPQPNPAKPGRYVLPLSEWREQDRGQTEVLSVHEAVPGHHVQLSIAFQRGGGEALDKVAVNAAFTEGWARYSETLAEEIGLYETDFAKVRRRAWPGHGQVVDVGVHFGGWSRERALAYLEANGQYDLTSAEAMLDRIAVLPGQLTAYDTGATEIFALRSEARARLGPRFSLPRFHEAVLGEGTVPLVELRAHVRSWIRSEGRRSTAAAGEHRRRVSIGPDLKP